MKTTTHDYSEGDAFLGAIDSRLRRGPRKQSWLRIILATVGVLALCGVLYIFSKIPSHHEPEKELKSSQKIMEDKHSKDPFAIKHKDLYKPIYEVHKCDCDMCKKWNYQGGVLDNRHPRKVDIVQGCKSHRMEWHQVTSSSTGHVLPGPGGRFQKPGVICDICDEDYKHIGRTLWKEKHQVLHSWTCHLCEWKDPDAVRKVFNSDTKEWEEHPVINHGVDICSECARKAPEELQKFREFGPEGKLIHEHHKDTASIVGQMRRRVKDEL